MDEFAVVVVETGHADALEVEACGDAVLDGVADPFVDPPADALEAPDLWGFGESVPVELLHAGGGDRPLPSGGSSVTDHAADVTGLADDSAIGIAASLPPGSESGVERL